MNLRSATEEVTVATSFVTPDEKAWLLHEGWSRQPLGMRRVQRIWVNRNGDLAVYMTDMGPAEQFAGVQRFQIPSLWEHSVAELQEIANWLRDGRPPDDRAPTDMIAAYCRDLEEEKALRRHRTTIGPYLTVQR